MADRARDGDLNAQSRPSVKGESSPQRLSPKRPRVETAGLADVFPYYAGFGFDFACHHIDLYGRGRGVVLDPWNGSGTTTLAAQSRGYLTVGVDLNPMANIAARLRGSRAADLNVCQPPSGTGNHDVSSDPLSAWLSASTVGRLRDWTSMLAERPSAQVPLVLVAIFRVVRRTTRRFEGSNPTWVRRAVDPADLVHLEAAELDRDIVTEQAMIVSKFIETPGSESPAAIVTGSSQALPIPDRAVDLILTSPPYLTRIDYAVAYARELAVLGFDIDNDRSFRRAMMGTTLTRTRHWTEPESFGPASKKLLDEVSAHSSKASAGYYRKQFGQYLEDLTASLDELTRVSRPNASMTLVVQDSYYKDIPVNLAAICQEEAEARGWHCESVDPFPVTRLLTAMNRSAQAYPKGQVSETVVRFTLRNEGNGPS